MDELIQKHTAVMDKYDPAKRVGLAVDEWGIWTDVEPGTNPGFLFQQNSMRDAVLAALNLHIFQAHADRVSMANIAQMVNVLQAMILTENDKIVLTPTYHVFEMLNVHQGATLVPIELTTPNLPGTSEHIPNVSASASRDAAGKIHLSLVNTSPDGPVTLNCVVAGADIKAPVGRVLTAADMTAHNTFDAAHAVEPQPFTGATVSGGKLNIVLPAMSVAILEL
jgi:alpha-N-arabinofuranosidase